MTMNSLLEAAHLSFTPMILDAVPMTKAETIMRREEAAKMKWPLLRTYVPTFMQQACIDVAARELLYGGAPGGGMSSL